MSQAINSNVFVGKRFVSHCKGAALWAALVLSIPYGGRAAQGSTLCFAFLRGGDVVGEHEVWFLGDGERLLLKHSATDRSVFARGALLAGQWLAGRPAGRYAMRDVFISGYR